MFKDARLDIRLSTKLRDRLAVLAAKEECSIGQVAREAIESYLAEKEAE